MTGLPFDERTLREARRIAQRTPPAETDPKVEALVTELIGRVADKWTMLILEVLHQHGELRFTQLARQVEGISQKMLTQTLRQMERDGMVTRTVHPVIPPRVDYRLTELGASLGAAFCGVWIWAEENLDKVEAARRAFDASGATVRR
ncbi:winged helix-turn-helix transcriptional regulator [Methylobacterium sp. ID0610]|uniref:winged helix-turn-helix transcriptional regulator n=1 Tax=Methylobacterium carpenticola TaxID=3344827 RepID=UPI0036C2A119